jgi:hypothetical protein
LRREQLFAERPLAAHETTAGSWPGTHELRRWCKNGSRVAAALVLAVLSSATPEARAAILYYSTHEASAFVETSQNGRIERSGCLFGCPMLDLHLGTPSITTGSATARVGAFLALAEAAAGPEAFARAGARGLMEFRVSGGDATWTAAATGRLGGRAVLADLTSGNVWNVDHETWPAPVVALLDGHDYRMTLTAAGNSVGGFYPGGMARVSFANATFRDIPEPATLPLAMLGLGLAGLVTATTRRR